MNPLYAVLMDGGFVTKLLGKKLGRFPSAEDIETECKRIAAHPGLKGYDLLRIYFYDAPPATGVFTNPIDRSKLDLSKTERYQDAQALFDALELRSNFALRKGETVFHGWQVGSKALASVTKAPRPLTATDLIPNIEQKGVDLRIGLDIARLALKGLVRVVVVLTGDSDLVPAFKFARREGIRVYLDHLGHGVRRDLKVHADLIL